MWISSTSNGPASMISPSLTSSTYDVAGELVLVELGARHRHRQRAAVDRRRVVHAELAQQERQAAEVVLVAVRDDDRLDVRDAAAQVGEVGQDEVDAHHLGRREAQADVDEDDPVLVLDDRHVLADLAQAAERQDAQRTAQRGSTFKPWRRRAARGPAASRGSSRSRARRPRRRAGAARRRRGRAGSARPCWLTAAGATLIASKTGSRLSWIAARWSGSSTMRRISGPTMWLAVEDPSGLAHVEDARRGSRRCRRRCTGRRSGRGCRCWPA